MIKALTLQFSRISWISCRSTLSCLQRFLCPGWVRLWPTGVLAASFGLWGAVQLNKNIALAAYPGPHQVWFFNPFAWQALFFLGAWCGWRGITGGVPWLTNRWLFRLAVAGALAAFLVRFSWTLHWLYDPVPALFCKALWPLLSKTNLSLLRFANVLILALLTGAFDPSPGDILDQPCRVAVRPLWASFIACLLSWYPYFRRLDVFSSTNSLAESSSSALSR